MSTETLTDTDYDSIWGTIEETAQEVDSKEITVINGQQEATAPDGHEREKEICLAVMDSIDPGPAPEELDGEPLAEAAGAVGHKPPKEGGSYVVYESDHDFKRYEYHSTGECKIWDGDSYVSSLNYLDENDTRPAFIQAMTHAANLRLGINTGFQIDTFQKLDWYHAKRVNIESEIETVKAALKSHLRLLENDQNRLMNLEDQAAQFASTLLKGKVKNVKMTHGTVNFTDKKESAVLDEAAEEARSEYIAKLYADEKKREAYGIAEIKSYKQDTSRFSKEELEHYLQYQNQLLKLKPNKDGEIEKPDYTPLHPGWKIKPAHRAVYFRPAKEK